MNWENLTDRKKREAAVKRLVGSEINESSSIALQTAEAVQEAARFMRQMREHAGLTQAALGQKLGVTQARISELERGGSPEGMSYALLRRAAMACGFDKWPSTPVQTKRKKVDRSPAAIPRRKEEALKVLEIGGIRRIRFDE